MLDPAIKELAQGKNFAMISFHLPNGAVATQVMWVDADDEHVLMNTEVHRAKYKSLQADPRVTVTIWDSAKPVSLRRGAGPAGRDGDRSGGPGHDRPARPEVHG